MQLSERNPVRRFSFAPLVTVALLVMLYASSAARGDLLEWDANGAAAPNPAGGSDTWSPTNSNWWNGSATQAYNTGATPHDTVFGVTAGAISISSPVTARSLRFDVSGYVLSGSELTLADASTITVTNTADTATIDAPLAGSAGLTKDGDGKLVLSGVNTFSGLAVLGGTVSVDDDEQLGDPTSGVNLDGAALLVTGSSSLKAAETRDFNIGSAGGIFDIQNSSNTGLTICGHLNGTGRLVKSGPGTLRLDAVNNMFAGGVTIEGGVMRFNNNNDAGPKALRMNAITFDPIAGAATLSIGGSGDNVDGGASELRTGRWVSASPGAGEIVAATTTTNSDGGSGHDLMIFALADAVFSGTVSNLATSNGGTVGTYSSNGDLAVRGNATQTLSGTTNVSNTVSVFDGAGLKLSGAASITGIEANLNINGGTFTLDNSVANLGDRFEDTGSVETRGGGTFVLIGNVGGSSETVGFIQLGTNTTTPPNARSGALSVQITHNAGASAATVLTFAGITRDSGRATVDFSARDGSGAMALGSAGNAPRIMLTAAPSMSANGLLNDGGSVGWATVNGSDFATYDAATGVKAVSTIAFAAAGSNDNALLTGGAVISASKTVASLKIAPSASQSLDLTGTGNLQTPAILLTGTEDFTIRNTGGGTGGLLTSAAQHVYVQQADLTISAPITGSGALIKSGAGALILGTANTYSGTTTINEGQLRTAHGVGLGPGVLEFRGGVLEITGGGTFNRHLDFGTPSGPGRISWTRVTGLPLPTLSKHDRGSGGFAAVGANVIVDLNGLGASDIVWEDPSFIASGYALILGSPNADARVDLVDNYGLGISPGSYNAREIRAIDNPNSTTDISRISGIVFSDSDANNGTLTDLLKSGDGTLEFTGNNTYVSGTIIAEGTLLLGHANALGQGDQSAYVLLGADGGTADVALLTSAPVSISRDITIPSGNGKATIGTSGTGTSGFSGQVIVGTSGAATGKVVDLLAEDGGTVIFSKGIDTADGQTGLGTLTKTGAGKVILEGISSFMGDTYVNAGTLQVDGTLLVTDDANVVVGGILDVNSVLVAEEINVTGGLLTNNGVGLIGTDRLTVSSGVVSATYPITVAESLTIGTEPVISVDPDHLFGIKGDNLLNNPLRELTLQGGVVTIDSGGSDTDMPEMDIIVVEHTVLDLGDATSATFGELIVAADTILTIKSDSPINLFAHSISGSGEVDITSLLGLTLRGFISPGDPDRVLTILGDAPVDAIADYVAMLDTMGFTPETENVAIACLDGYSYPVISAVPEPATLGLLVLGSIVLTRRRKRASYRT